MHWSSKKNGAIDLSTARPYLTSLCVLGALLMVLGLTYSSAAMAGGRGYHVPRPTPPPAENRDPRAEPTEAVPGWCRVRDPDLDRLSITLTFRKVGSGNNCKTEVVNSGYYFDKCYNSARERGFPDNSPFFDVTCRLWYPSCSVSDYHRFDYRTSFAPIVTYTQAGKDNQGLRCQALNRCLRESNLREQRVVALQWHNKWRCPSY